ncbi:P-loop ATPase, Sll1717 family [Herpetosiphon geysericola]|uniref:Uncharacterized protein n=1 Tax=Herpetosiphon geysericola TaxID=70996 RepID=A0A0P6XL55_9CHLR|nr:hypothetical protein [Herpetosiphon geysericola]KPL80625.1 hypothetical protein SE18_23720 [Herpetosiphon geysericola]
MTPFDIHSLIFGSDDAEFDQKNGFLSKVFLSTAVYERIKRYNKEVVIGRKGSGKSAICIMLKNALDEDGKVILITPDSLSQSKISSLKSSSINEEESYILSWKYLIATILGKAIVEDKKIFSKYSEFKKIKRFLIENREIKKRLFNFKVGSFAKMTISTPIGSIEFDPKQTQIDAATELDEFIQSISRILIKDNNRKYTLLMDKIDDIWNQTNESRMMVIGLLKSIHILNNIFHNIKIITFLRSDIYDILIFNDRDKLRSREERIEWDKDGLKRMICNRARISSNIDEDDIDTVWRMVFPENVKNQASFQYMIDRTLMRPRDIIYFCNISLNEAQNKQRTKISEEDVLLAEEQYSVWKSQDIISEFFVQYPYLENIFNEFYDCTSPLPDGKLLDVHGNLISSSNKYQEDGISVEKLFQILYYVGFLGIRRDNVDNFSHKNQYMTANENDLLIIHPLFFSSLRIKYSSIIKVSDMNINSGIAHGVVIGVNSGSIIRSSPIGKEDSINHYKKILELYISNLKNIERNIELQRAKYGTLTTLQLHNQFTSVQAEIDTIRKIIIGLEDESSQ